MKDEYFEPLVVEDISRRDAEDIAAAQAGDGNAYRRLIERYQGQIAVQMRRFSRHPLEHEELVHDVFVEVYHSLRTFRGSSPWIHWLRKIAVRVGYRFWKQGRRTSAEVSLSEEDWERLGGTLPLPGEAADAADLVHTVLALLNPDDRLVLTLLYLEECTMAEAAARAGWTTLGTKVRAFRARQRLKKKLEDRAP